MILLLTMALTLGGVVGYTIGYVVGIVDTEKRWAEAVDRAEDRR